jgi:hypothetical protein
VQYFRKISKFRQLRERRLISEESLGCHANKRLSKIMMQLAAKDIEIVGRDSVDDNTLVCILHLLTLALVL